MSTYSGRPGRGAGRKRREAKAWDAFERQRKHDGDTSKLDALEMLPRVSRANVEGAGHDLEADLSPVVTRG